MTLFERLIISSGPFYCHSSPFSRQSSKTLRWKYTSLQPSQNLLAFSSCDNYVVNPLWISHLLFLLFSLRSSHRPCGYGNIPSEQSKTPNSFKSLHIQSDTVRDLRSWPGVYQFWGLCSHHYLRQYLQHPEADFLLEYPALTLLFNQALIHCSVMDLTATATALKLCFPSPTQGSQKWAFHHRSHHTEAACRSQTDCV